MITVSIVELKAKASELVHRAENGERIVITRNGKNVAEISASNPLSISSVEKEAWLRSRIAQQTTSNGPISSEEIRDWINEGRR
jgi:antitoxin (DNA-binding transcriptional repressor) of toxin-antitoxin stability system